jgi:hypothetical protein
MEIFDTTIQSIIFSRCGWAPPSIIRTWLISENEWVSEWCGSTQRLPTNRTGGRVDAGWNGNSSLLTDADPGRARQHVIVSWPIVAVDLGSDGRDGSTGQYRQFQQGIARTSAGGLGAMHCGEGSCQRSMNWTIERSWFLYREVISAGS